MKKFILSVMFVVGGLAVNAQTTPKAKTTAQKEACKSECCKKKSTANADKKSCCKNEKALSALRRPVAKPLTDKKSN